MTVFRDGGAETVSTPFETNRAADDTFRDDIEYVRDVQVFYAPKHSVFADSGDEETVFDDDAQYVSSPDSGEVSDSVEETTQETRKNIFRESFISLFFVSLVSAGVAFLVAFFVFNSSVFRGGNVSAPTVGATGPALVDSSLSSPDWSAVAQAVKPSTVSVRAVNGSQGAQGAGFIYDSENHVVTNAHVLTGQKTFSVQADNGVIVEADIVGVDITTDIAVLKMKRSPKGVTPASLGDSSTVQVGQPVATVGNPLGLSQTVSAGIVSALNRPISVDVAGDTVVTNAIQIDAATNQGNSGGALVDGQGRVIGVTSSHAHVDNSEGKNQSVGIGFAIPINVVKSIADELIRTGTVAHATLGADGETVWIRAGSISQLGAHIKTLDAQGAAKKAGLRVDDTVISCNGLPIVSMQALDGTVRTYRPGDTVVLEVVRDGRTHTISVVLASQ